MTMVEKITGKEGAGIISDAQRGVQANATSAIAMNNALCDIKYLESLKNQIGREGDKKILQNVINQWTEKSTLTQHDVKAKYGTLYLCEYQISDKREYTACSLLKDPKFIVQLEYQEYFKSLLKLTQKLTGKIFDFPRDKIPDGKFDGNRNDTNALIEELNKNRDSLDGMYDILGKDTTIPIGVDNDGNIIYCGLRSGGRCFYRSSSDFSLGGKDCPVVSKLR